MSIRGLHPPSTKLQQLPASLRTLIEAELAEGEAITWVGRQIPRKAAWGSFAIVLFGIPWTAFALFWVAGAAQFQVPDFKEGFDFFPLFGMPFVLVGFAMLSSPLWLMHKARNTAYVLTTSRAITFNGGFSTTIRSFSPSRLTNLRRKQRSDGSGDLIFGRDMSFDSDGDRRAAEYGFLAISGVKAVEDRVRQLVSSSKKTG